MSDPSDSPGDQSALGAARADASPVAISAVSADSLARQAIVTESDLQNSVPGLSVKASQGSNQLNYSLRGQTVDAFTSSRPSVLPYVNEVQVGGSGSTAFYDLQSVQVLKGPQGTLFGRNSTGGEPEDTPLASPSTPARCLAWAGPATKGARTAAASNT